ncbi:MAG TPA: hypothetical protein V6C63_17730 [Allocoleopsis sp.]
MQAPFPYNATAWAKLQSVQSAGQQIEALLLEYEPEGKEEKLAWGFLINPQSLDFENAANYGEVATHATTVTSSQYSHTSGQTLTIPGMMFSLWCYKKSVRTLLDGLKKLLEADPINGRFAPALLRFSWGSYSLGPLSLIKYSYRITAVANGEPTDVRDLTLTFKEQPRPLTKAEQEQRAQQRLKQQMADAVAKGAPKLPLTERQQKDAIAAAEKYLKENITQWSADVQALLKANADIKKLLTVDAKTGVVTLNGKDNTKIGVVLQYDGTIGTAGKTCTVPVKPGAKAPDIPKPATTAPAATTTTTEMMM